MVLTRRAFAKGENMPMAGVPYHSAEGYIQKLIGAGYKVAVAEQLEQPRGDQETQARRTRLGKAPSAVTTNYANTDELGISRTGLVDRQVVRVVTPGTLTEPGLLDARRNNYLAAIVLEGDRAGIAYVDITTGEFQATEVRSANELPLLVQQELDRLQPSELLVPQAVTDATRAVYKAWSAEARTDGEPGAVPRTGRRQATGPPQSAATGNGAATTPRRPSKPGACPAISPPPTSAPGGWRQRVRCCVLSSKSPRWRASAWRSCRGRRGRRGDPGLSQRDARQRPGPTDPPRHLQHRVLHGARPGHPAQPGNHRLDQRLEAIFAAERD